MLKDDDVMKWGKHQGKKMANIPAQYLLWLYDQPFLKDKDVKAYIKDNLDVLKLEIKREQTRTINTSSEQE